MRLSLLLLFVTSNLFAAVNAVDGSISLTATKRVERGEEAIGGLLKTYIAPEGQSFLVAQLRLKTDTKDKVDIKAKELVLKNKAGATAKIVGSRDNREPLDGTLSIDASPNLGRIEGELPLTLLFTVDVKQSGPWTLTIAGVDIKLGQATDADSWRPEVIGAIAPFAASWADKLYVEEDPFRKISETGFQSELTAEKGKILLLTVRISHSKPNKDSGRRIAFLISPRDIALQLPNGGQIAAAGAVFSKTKAGQPGFSYQGDYSDSTYRRPDRTEHKEAKTKMMTYGFVVPSDFTTAELVYRNKTWGTVSGPK